jgi:glycosyltransferase involved in cell wall biosynthesis
MLDNPQATVVITTKNRKQELRRAIRSTLNQTVVPRVLVIDDGSTDGTCVMVREEFPTVFIERSERSQGCIRQRNWAAELITTSVIISIDDDAEFSSPYTVAQTLQEFDDRCIGAVAIPFINIRQDNKIRQKAIDATDCYVAPSFVGTAYAIRREVFLSLGGYREYFLHQGEEEDLCVRMLNAGYLIRLGSADAIYHYESPIRDRYRMDVFGPRNLVLFTWYNVPMPYMPAHIIVTVVKALLYGVKVRCVHRKLYGTYLGCRALLHELHQRRPVSRQAYKVFRLLKSRGYAPISKARERLLVITE